MKKVVLISSFLVALASVTVMNAKMLQANRYTILSSPTAEQVVDMDTLRLDGPETSFSNHTESTTGNLFKDPPMMQVKYGLSSKGLLTINASEPLDSITVKDVEGIVVKNYELQGEKDVEFDLNTMPTGHLEFLLKGKNGAENTLQVDN